MKKLRYRFIDDFGYQVTVVEDPYFEYQLSLNPGAEDDWEKLEKGIKEEYDGNEEAFLEEFYATKRAMLQTLQTSEEWGAAEVPNSPEVKANKHNFYTQEYADKGRIFMSIDLRKANVQAFAKIDPLLFGWPSNDIEVPYSADYLWKNFVRKHIPYEKKTLWWYVCRSKHIRQVIFGNCDPKKQVAIERTMVWEQTKEVFKVYPDAKVLMFGTDEVILEMGKMPDRYIPRVPRVDTRIEVFSLKSIPFLTPSGNIIRVYEREGIDYKCIPRNYYAQIIKLLRGEEPGEMDLVFYSEKELSKFIGKLKKLPSET